MKIELDDVISAATLVGIEGDAKSELIKKITDLANQAQAEKDANKLPKKPKGEYVVILKSPGEIPDNTVASVFMIPNGADPATLINSIKSATVTFNTTKNKKKDALTKFADIILRLKPKFQKPDFKILTKEYIQVLSIKPEEDEQFIVTKVSEKENFS